jgi:centrosomal protein CEP76
MSVEKGDIQDHCILLCSLLLGFHLDAYVTLGTDSTNSAHMWVTTIDARGTAKVHPPSYYNILGNAKFWEPLTGVQFGQTDNHHFRTVGCCFNNNNLYANIQVLDAAEKVKFKISDPSYWKKMENTDPLPSPSIGFTLLPPAELNIKIAELEIEQVLKQLVEFYRKDHYLACSWDESLPTLLGQSLWSMEYGKVSGQSISHFSDDFQMGVKRSIPDGHTFKGFPMAFNHTHPQRMMQTMSKSKQCREILVTRGDVVRMAIRVKIFVYCERVICCWVMIASRSLQ